MQKIIFIFSFILFANFSFAQINLVPNPSFEDTIGCPQGYPDLDTKCQFWKSFRGTPDYYNNCSQACGFYNQGGFQQPNTGVAYAGFNMYLTTLPNASEQISVQLLSPLIMGTKYYLSFYVSNAYNPLITNIACNNIGLLLTTYQYSDPNGAFSLPDTCTIQTSAIISDTIKWTKISGSFVADSNFQYLIIGVFYNDSYLDTIQYPNIVGPYDAYYYLDDVCVTTDSLFNENWIGVNDFNNILNQINVFPNPASDVVTISFQNNQGNEIILTDVYGKVCYSKEIKNENTAKINLSAYPSGMHFLKIINSKREISISKKIIKL